MLEAIEWIEKIDEDLWRIDLDSKVWNWVRQRALQVLFLDEIETKCPKHLHGTDSKWNSEEWVFYLNLEGEDIPVYVYRNLLIEKQAA